MARVNNLPKGSKNHRSKLHESVIPNIKIAVSLGMKDIPLAKQFGVSPKAIYNIRTGKTWTHVK